MFCLQIWWLDTLIDSMMKISITSLLNSLFILLSSPTLGFGTGRSPTGGLISQQNVRNEESLTNVSTGHPETQVMTQGEQIQGDIRHFTTPDKALLSHIIPCLLSSRKLCVQEATLTTSMRVPWHGMRTTHCWGWTRWSLTPWCWSSDPVNPGTTPWSGE